MKISFSTLACPDWTLPEAVELAVSCGYEGLELRFLEGEDSLWKLPAFQGRQLQQSCRLISESGLAIACVDTSCRFDSPDPPERNKWLSEGERMAELAAQLGAPAIRVFGDRIQPGASRQSTVHWISESLNVLAKKIHDSGMQIWLETHGDFASASDVQIILSNCPEIQIVWDPACAFIERGERPLDQGLALQRWIRHVHIKDLRNENGSYIPVLTGNGEFPLAEIQRATDIIGYTGFLSFEWEKKWHASIEPADISIPHFAKWFRTEWKTLAAMPSTDVPAHGGIR